jgi:uncharacterized membrane protein
MRSWSNRQRLWFYRGLTLLATAILVHLLVVWATPRLIMNRLMTGPAAQAMAMRNQAAFPPAVDASARRVVMPSPDLLYSVNVFDVSAGPVRVRANPGLPSYWSIALYAANSDNFFVLNDRQAGTDPIHAGLMHPTLIALLGLCLGELWDLEALAEDCAATGVYECFLSCKPLNLTGGVGSPANAMAIV